MTVSIEELHEIINQIGLSMKESDIRRAEEDKRRAERREESDRCREEMERALLESRAETERVLRESRAELMELHKSTERSVERLSKNIGGLNNSVGEIVEMIIIPGLKEKMREFQHNFFMASPGKEFSGPDGGKLTEVDLLLENCDEVMVVEVKTQVSVKWVDKHLKRLELLRKNEKITGMTGKVMYAAMAGINFDGEARDLAVKNGMYIIEIEEEQERVKVFPPPGKVGTW
jgi:hypothetical protein